MSEKNIGLDPNTLKGLDALFRKAKTMEPATDGFTNLPDGDYMCLVDEVSLVETKTTKAPMIKWVFKVAEGEEHAGRIIFMNTVLTSKDGSADNMNRFVTDVRKFYNAYEDLGEFPESFDELIANLDVLVGQFCIASLKTSRSGNQNTKIILELEDDEEDDE